MYLEAHAVLETLPLTRNQSRAVDTTQRRWIFPFQFPLRQRLHIYPISMAGLRHRIS